MLNTPAWWYRKNAEGAPWWRPVLWPLSLIWRAVNEAKRKAAKPYRSTLHVISVGNLTLGGSGKTPVTGEILRLLEGRGVVGLSKGYGGTVDGPVRVDPARHSAAEVGDEPLMLGQSLPFMVAKDRVAGLKALEQTDAKIVVVDDAHQNLKIAKDRHVLVIDGDTRDGAWPFGDEGICPYGPMREPFEAGLARADVCVLWLPDEAARPDPELMARLAAKPVFVARLIAQKPSWTGPVLGFAAIAKPWKFRQTLDLLGFEVVDFKDLPDHAALSEAELDALYQTAQAAGARLITTEKDWVKLSPDWRDRVLCLPIQARFDDSATLVANLLGGA